MNFERHKEPKEALGIGMDEVIIQRLDEQVRRMNLNIKFTRHKKGNRLATWSNGPGGYATIIKYDKPWPDPDTKYPLYGIEWDSGGSFANERIDGWVGDIHYESEFKSPWFMIAYE